MRCPRGGPGRCPRQALNAHAFAVLGVVDISLVSSPELSWAVGKPLGLTAALRDPRSLTELVVSLRR
eukprot:389461-Alexandrium_andersonii.AAC.1